jgi:IS30 family transposase
LDAVGGLSARETDRSVLRLSLAEREEISIGLRTEQTMAAIARRLQRAPSTISREIANNGGRRRYRAAAADRAAQRRARRPKIAKLAHRSSCVTRSSRCLICAGRRSRSPRH